MDVGSFGVAVVATPGPRDSKHGGLPSAVLGVFAAVYTERAALRALSEHGSPEPDPG